MMNTIHSTAIVDPQARLGDGIEVGPYAIIERDVEIGDGTHIGARASILRYSRIGAGCRVHTGAVIGDLPQDLAFTERPSYVRIGNECVIREFVTIHRGTKPETETVVGNRCFLMANAHLAHNVVLADNVILANGVLLAGYVSVGERAFLGGAAAVHQFCRIGRIAMIGGSAAISKDVPPFCITRPGGQNLLVGLNIIGLRRAGMTAEDRLLIKRAFRTLYRSGLNVTQALAELRAATHPLIQEIIAFVEASKRGICPLAGKADEGTDE